MPKITVVGAGIVGLSVARLLCRSHEVTVIARDLPGDKPSLDWASPWAGAVFLGLDGSTPREQEMQRDSFAYLWALAVTHPESSVRRIEMHDLQETTTLDKIWYRDFMPEVTHAFKFTKSQVNTRIHSNTIHLQFRVMGLEELPSGVSLGMSYKTIVLSPPVFLPWLANQLKENGVVFRRQTIKSLADLADHGHDVLVNATAFGSKFLHDVADQNLVQVRGQTILVKTDFERIVMRHGKHYTYAIARLDGTAILGGIKQEGNTDPIVDIDLRNDILRRVHESAPEVFKEGKVENVEIVRDNVGLRPARVGGVRVEKQVVGTQNVVHAYGTSGGGYVFSFGVAKAVERLVNDFLTEYDEYLQLSREFVGPRLQKLVRKVDWHVLPQLIIIYLLSYVDRSNAGNAKLFGAIPDMGMTGQDWNTALSVFFITYAAGGVDSFTHDDILLWCIRCTPGSAGAFSGLLAYGIGHLDYTWGFRGWRFIYCIEGLFSLAVAITAFWALNDTPGKVTKWLTPEEKRFLVLRHRYAAGGETGVPEQEEFSWKAAKDAFTSFHIYAIALTEFTLCVTVYGYSYILPTIINNLGYSAANAQAMTAPPYIFACIVTVFSGWAADRYKQRMLSVFLPNLLAAVGFVIMMIVGSNIYIAEQSPTYPIGFGISLGMLSVFGVIWPVIYYFILKRINANRAAIPIQDIYEKHTEEELSQMGDRSPLFRYAT
ncbi:kinesin [Purpureocillium lavendulum]|uniref:Kinesin n=1 Tax=Purpureocillium lavendulum TaxID=1247861 RepID=A0AB34FNT1_9HYPO|nr:kinesin [Purpureocillium lavendulum]